MNSLNKATDYEISKYLKEPREKILFYRASVFYIFALYVMPQYFGIPNPIFDFTIVRIAIVILLVFIAFDYSRIRDFISCITHERMSLALLPYVFVLLYTMVLRVDINAFLNPFIELLELYLLIYVIKDSLGTEKTIKIIQVFIYILVILGFVEMVIKKSPFSYLETIKGTYTGVFIRGEHYRIMSNAVHSIGYGLILVTAMPFAGLDVDEKTFNILRRPILLIGIIVNIFETGSRSTLGIMFAEVLLMLVFSDKKYMKNNILIVFASAITFTVALFLLQGTSVGRYILLQITSVIDSLFNTSISLKYGADETLGQSASYRKLLKQVFFVDWLNPLLGIGRKRGFASEINGLVVESIDNYYIAEYIRYAYPGMFSYIFFLVYVGVCMLKDMYRTRSAIIRAVFVGALSYCLHLYIADSLQTLKYLYVLLALYICCEKTDFIPEEPGRYFKKRKSRYVKS